MKLYLKLKQLKSMNRKINYEDKKDEHSITCMLQKVSCRHLASTPKL